MPTKHAPTISETVAYGLAAPTRSKPGSADAEDALLQLREFADSLADRPDRVARARANHNAARLAEFRAALPGGVPDNDVMIAACAAWFQRVSARPAWFVAPGGV